MICLLLTACNASENMSGKANYNPDCIYNIYIEKDYKAAKYETDNCYLGAYILSDKNVNFSIKDFENLVEKKHTSYIYHINTADEFPLNWVLECLINKATPCFVVTPENINNPFNTNTAEFAKKFSILKIPMFVQFYPNPNVESYDAQEYKEFFIKARNDFNIYAPNAAFVWSVSSSDMFTSNEFYPGNDYVDWVGINIYEDIQNQKLNSISNEVDYFCYMYQEYKPIMISQFGVSHYTSDGHKYFINQALEELTKMYSVIIPNQSRIKAIYYMDFNNVMLSPKNTKCDNFSITDDKKITQKYKDLISSGNYISELENKNMEKALIKYPFTAYKLNNDLYISKDFYHKLIGSETNSDIIIINNTQCIKAKTALNEKGYYITESGNSVIIKS